MSTITQIKQSEFEEIALKAEGLVVVDFTATWCGPCKRLAVELEAAALELGTTATIVKVDVDESPELASRYGVQGIPNLTFLKNGSVVDTIIGAVPRTTIIERAKAKI
ncbi:thioredoxin TrxA [soil metagenome]